MANAARDDNFVTTLSATSSADHSTPLNVDADPTTRRLLVNSTISGSITATTSNSPDGTAFVAGTSAGNLVLGAYESSPTSLTNGSAGVIGLTAQRAVKMTPYDSGGTDMSDTVNHAVKVNVVAGAASNAAAGTTGAAVPASADYSGLNLSGTLRGQTGANPTGTVYAAHTDLTSLGNGTALAVNNGAVSNGTLRVTIASDSTGQVTLASGANTIGNVGINAGGNTIGTAFTDQRFIKGVAVDVGNGTQSTGTQRVTIASDSTGQVVLAAGGNTVGTVFADVKKLNGTVVDTNNGTTSAGTLRVTLSSDSTGIVGLSAGSNTIGTAYSIGDRAAGATDGGNPVKIGGFATATLSTATLRTAGQRTNLVADLDEAVITRPYATLGDTTTGTANVTSTASATVISAAGANVKVYLKSITIANANGTSQLVEIMDGNITRWLFPVPCGTAGVTHGGVTHTWGGNGLPGTANTNWNVRCSAAGGNIYVSMEGYKSKI